MATKPRTLVWVASRSPKGESALLPSNLIEICSGGPFPQQDAEQYAKDETLATGNKTYVYAVELVLDKGYEIYKEVHAFDPTK